jgi:hypothetical protein
MAVPGRPIEYLKAMTIRAFLFEAIMVVAVVVISGAVSLFIVTAFLHIMGQHSWLDSF